MRLKRRYATRVWLMKICYGTISLVRWRGNELFFGNLKVYLYFLSFCAPQMTRKTRIRLFYIDYIISMGWCKKDVLTHRGYVFLTQTNRFVIYSLYIRADSRCHGINSHGIGSVLPKHSCLDTIIVKFERFCPIQLQRYIQKYHFAFYHRTFIHWIGDYGS